MTRLRAAAAGLAATAAALAAAVPGPLDDWTPRLQRVYDRVILVADGTPDGDGPPLRTRIDQPALATFRAYEDYLRFLRHLDDAKVRATTLDQRVPFLINLHNVLMIKSLDPASPDGLRPGYWTAPHPLGTSDITLAGLDEQFREAAEPRALLALYRHTPATPPFWPRALQSDGFEDELDRIARSACRDPALITLSADGRTLTLAPLFEEYANVFERGVRRIPVPLRDLPQPRRAILAFIAEHAPRPTASAVLARPPDVVFRAAE